MCDRVIIELAFISDNTTTMTNSNDDDFASMMDGVKPLKNSGRLHTPKVIKPNEIKSAAKNINKNYRQQAAQNFQQPTVIQEAYNAEIKAIDGVETVSFFRPGLQQRVKKQLRKATPVDTLDLHGYNLAKAYPMLKQFIQFHQSAHQVSILIVHGKGRHAAKSPHAVLKSAVCQWLQEMPAVLAYMSANPEDGGTGAIYVLLKAAV